jgi:deoxycytidylate deaminase
MRTKCLLVKLAMSEHHYKLAVNMAKKSISRFRLGAVLARRNRVISTGFNDMRKSHPLQQKYARGIDFTMGLHAEVDSCLGVSRNELEGAELYVARILKDGTTALSKPCEVCYRFLVNVGIKKIHYSTPDHWLTLNILNL